MPELKMGLPKGSLQESTLALLAQAGWKFTVGSRSYYPTCDDGEINAMLARPQEMSRYVERGALDVAITGLDWTVENDSDVVVLERLVYAKATRQPVRWVLAVPEDSRYRVAADLAGKVISTEVVNLTKKYFAEKKVEVTVEFSHGATEVKVPHLADAIVDVTETGSSLRANRLRIIDTIQESVTVVIVNKNAYADSWKKPKIDALCLMLRGAFDAREKVLLKMNAPVEKVPELVKLLPALNSPTVNKLADEKWVAIETIVEEPVVRTLIPELKRCGAEGLIELPLNKVIR
ncbi:ATP phosphoribosyltransferase [Planctomycetales bacterium]|nr:ATP phosphoribosyltransferase [Planctomycetales bacterium]GHS96149.1 ATP phosphoribosyltransferase [Planctomycetales bacterium]GHT04282.1 ATP phosphoribosyltransferase [Planctomycetales bacterium]GHV19570.1 ATP phosphoribosyltransferase [Planctomycetales bacterium]